MNATGEGESDDHGADTSVNDALHPLGEVESGSDTPAPLSTSPVDNGWFKELVHLYHKRLKQDRKPNSSADGLVLAMLTVRKWVLDSDNEGSLDQYKSSKISADECSSLIYKSQSEMSTNTDVVGPDPDDDDKTNSKKDISMVTLKLQSYFLENHKSFHTTSLERKTGLDDLIKPILQKFDLPDNTQAPGESSTTKKNEPSVQELRKDIRSLSNLCAKRFSFKTGSWGAVTEGEDDLINALCADADFNEHWCEQSVDDRQNRLESTIASVVGRRIFMLVDSCGEFTSQTLMAKARLSGAVANKIVHERILQSLDVAKLIVQLLSNDTEEVSKWVRRFNNTCYLVMINAWQHFICLQELQSSVSSNTRTTEQQCEIIRESFSKLHDGEDDIDIFRKIFIASEQLENLTIYFDRIHNTAISLDEFLMQDAKNFIQKGSVEIPQSLLLPRTSIDKVVATLENSINDLHKLISTLLESSNSVNSRRASRAMNSSPGKRTSRRSLIGQTAGKNQSGTSDMLVTNTAKSEVLSIDPDTVAESRFHNQVKFHPPGVDLVQSTGVACPYSQIPVAIGGFCPVAASRPNFLLHPIDRSLGLISYDDVLFGFSTVDAAYDFLNNPPSYLERIRDKALERTDLIELLDLTDYFLDYTIEARKIKLDGQMNDVVETLSQEKVQGQNGDVYSWGCRALTMYAKSGEKARRKLVQTAAVSCVGRALSSGIVYAEAVTSALQAVKVLSLDDVATKQYHDIGVVKLIFDAFEKHAKNNDLKIRALEALQQVSKDELHCNDIQKCGGSVHFIDTIKTIHQGPTFLCGLLLTMTNCAQLNSTMREEFVFEGLLPIMYDILKVYRDNPDVTEQSCELLSRLCITKELRNTICRDGLGLKLLDLMTSSMQHANVLQACCKLLARLCENLDTCLEVLAEGGVSVVMHAMKMHQRHIDTQLNGCWAIIEIAGGAADAKDLDTLKTTGNIEDDDDNEDRRDVIFMVLESMQRHDKVQEIQQYGCKALENLAARSSEQRALIAKANGVQSILKGAKFHKTTASVQESALHALSTLAGNDSKMHFHMTQIRALSYLNDIVKVHAANSEVQACACRFLANLVLHEEVRNLAVKENCIQWVFDALRRFDQDIDVNHYGLWALVNFAADFKVRESINARSNKSLIFEAISKLKFEPEVQLAGLRLLERMTLKENGKPTLSERAVKLMLQSMTASINDNEVVAVALSGLSSLCSDVRNRDAFVNFDGIKSIMKAVTQHRSDTVICRGACALLGHSVFKNARNKAAITQIGAVDIVVASMTQDLFDVEVQINGCTFLRNYTAQSDSARTDAIRKGAVQALTKTLTEHLADPILCYWVIGTLNNLCRDQSAKSILKNSGVVRMCRDILDHEHPSSQVCTATTELVDRICAKGTLKPGRV